MKKYNHISAQEKMKILCAFEKALKKKLKTKKSSTK